MIPVDGALRSEAWCLSQLAWNLANAFGISDFVLPRKGRGAIFFSPAIYPL